MFAGGATVDRDEWQGKNARGVHGVLVVRVLMAGAVAAMALLALWAAGRRHRDTNVGAAAIDHYACPMHPQVDAHRPGDCPWCGMALVPVAARDSAGGIRERPPRPTDRPGPDVVETFHVVTVAGRDLAAAAVAPARVAAPGLIAASFYLDEVMRMSTDEAGTFIAAAARAPAVVSAETSPPAGRPIRRTEDRPAPGTAAGPGPSLAEIPFRFDDGASTAPVGSTGWVSLKPRAGHALVVPYWAVLESAEGPRVFVLSAAEARFTRRAVELGRVFAGYVPVLSGLKAGERIATRFIASLDADVGGVGLGAVGQPR